MANLGGVLRYQELWTTARELRARETDSNFPPLYVPGLKSLWRNGLQRGTLAEINGRRSSGRWSVCCQLLAQATRAGEICAVIDLFNSFDLASASVSGVRLDRLVWIRCSGNAEHALRATDLVIHAGGFGIVLLDLCDAPPRILNRIPLSYWYRFQRAVEHTSAVVLVCANTPQSRSCSSAGVELNRKCVNWAGKMPFHLLRSLEVNAVLKAAAVAPSRLSLHNFSHSVPSDAAQLHAV